MASVLEPENKTERWLTCRLDKGMFSDEIAVTYPPEGSAQKSVFVSAKKVKGEPGGHGKVWVVVIHRDGSTMAVLPSATRDIVYAEEQDISEE